MNHNSFPLRFLVYAAFLLALAPPTEAQGGSRGAQNPFAAPDATVHYAPDRMYDLQNLVLDLNVDYPNRLLTATATNSIEAIRDGVTKLRFHAGADTKIEGVDLNGRKAPFTRDDEGILVECPPTKTGEKDTVVIRYHLKKSEEVHGQSGGWHFHEPKKNDPSKTGLFTNGETSDTRDWAVTWDYPNDFTTSETRTTVPAEWEVIGNGTLISDAVNPGGKTRTVVWRMTQAHATYLTSVVAGLFDIKKDTWRGMPLYFVVPKGKGGLIDYSFAHTKDMLSFYSDNLGIKYPWPKYAQDCTYDFGGGQENVSATTLGENFLTDPRDGYDSMDWLTSHEMAHQWFGDYVTCKDWGQIWLNESFATFMEMSYTLHSRGLNASQREVEANSQGYFDESRRYKRPLATNFYSNPGVMFDQHTYPKGGALLFTLRKMLGEKTFYSGLNLYITRFHNGPAETNDLCEAMTDATGINLHPWFDQWVLKPGHPVIQWSWAWDEGAKRVVLHVKQIQDTTKGTPIYDVPTKVALLGKGKRMQLTPIHLTDADQTFQVLTDAKPDAVVFDPDHDFVREIPKQPWSAAEMPVVAGSGVDCVQRQEAFSQMLSDKPSDETVQVATSILKEDQERYPAVEDDSKLSSLKREDLRAFWISELNHESFQRRNSAVGALGELANDASTNEKLRGLINDNQPYQVVSGAITALAKLDYAGSKQLIFQQANGAKNATIKGAALQALVVHDEPGAADMVFKCLDDTEPDAIQTAGMAILEFLKGNDPRVLKAVKAGIHADEFGIVAAAINLAKKRKMREVIPDLQDLKKQRPFAAGFVDEAIKEIGG